MIHGRLGMNPCRNLKDILILAEGFTGFCRQAIRIAGILVEHNCCA